MQRTLRILTFLMTFAVALAPRAWGQEPACEALPEVTPSYEGAHLQLESLYHDFGEVERRGGDLVHEFNFTNDGSAPLVILGAMTSCTCLKVYYPKDPIASGRSGCIRVVYEPHKIEPGSFCRVIPILSNSVGGRVLITVCGSSIENKKR